MKQPNTFTRAVPAAAAALLLGLAALGPAACGGDPHAAEARRALGTQLGSGRPGLAPDRAGAQAASVDDLAAARRYLEATLRLDPSNAGARAALAGLGVEPDPTLAFTDPSRLPGPVASRAAPGRRAATFPQGAVGELGQSADDLTDAGEPWPRVAAAPERPTARNAADSAAAVAAFLGARTAAADSTARESSRENSARADRGRDRTRARAAATRRPQAHLAAADQTAREDSLSRADSLVAARNEPGDTAAAPRGKHKRTWPWTRAQRWLVAKGIVGGSGAGVVVGALIGNVPGALIAGSLGGGALGFKKATKIGPADPYPTPRDSAAFDAEKRAREQRERADTTSRVAARP